MKLTDKELATATKGQLMLKGEKGGICTDTRALTENDWFLALSGERFDGHNYLNQAAEKGCKGVVANRVPEAWSLGWIKVEDTLKALQNIAKWRRKRFDGQVVGITGSAGKTTTRAMIGSICQTQTNCHQTAGNFNNHIGLPLTLIAAPKASSLWVIEMGMNHLGEIDLLQEIAKPTIRLITNIGAAHTEGVGSIAGVAQAKQELFDGAREGDVCCINDDDPWIVQMPLRNNVKTIRYGTSSKCDVQLLSATLNKENLSTDIRLKWPSGETIALVLNSPGLHLANNACASAAVAFALGLSPQDVVDGLTQYSPVGARLKVEQGPLNITTLNDSYNANPLSTKASLNTLAKLKPRRCIALLGDMLELGSTEEQAHRDIVSYALGLKLDLVGLVGTRYAAAAKGIPNILLARDSDEMASMLAKRISGDEVILLKGSRGMKMERILSHLKSL